MRGVEICRPEERTLIHHGILLLANKGEIVAVVTIRLARSRI